MREILSVENMRKSDAHHIATQTPSKDLMYRAAEGVYRELTIRLNQGICRAPVAIVCGYGNNAGDGYALATMLKQSDIEVEIIILAQKFSDDGRYYYENCLREGIKIIEYAKDEFIFKKYNTIVDCIFGTGFRGEVSGIEKLIIDAINSSEAYVISVDINSGMNGDSGMPTSKDETSVVMSDLTVSIGGFKSGHFLGKAKDIIRKKLNCDIGIKPVLQPYYLFEADDLKSAFIERKNYSNKSTYGYIALIGGSPNYQGAIRLASSSAINALISSDDDNITPLAANSNAAMRSGAGVARIAFPKFLYPYIAKDVLESTLFPLSELDGELTFIREEADKLINNCSAIAYGMGIGRAEGAKDYLKYLLSDYEDRLIIDADGLGILADFEIETIKRAKPSLILSPHIKEFSRLCKREISKILENPVTAVLEYTKKISDGNENKKRAVILKGPSTIISDGIKTYIVDRGCAGMATAGSGDVLSGVLAAMTAKSEDITLSSAAAVYICGCAGELAEKKYGAISMIASDTITELPDVIKSAF